MSREFLEVGFQVEAVLQRLERHPAQVLQSEAHLQAERQLIRQGALEDGGVILTSIRLEAREGVEGSKPSTWKLRVSRPEATDLEKGSVVTEQRKSKRSWVRTSQLKIGLHCQVKKNM